MADYSSRSRSRKASGKRVPFSFNIGTIIFGAILIYIVIFLIAYFSTEHVTYYQVVKGPLSRNQTYTGIALRTEDVITSDTSGYLYYYVQGEAKVKKTGALFGSGPEADDATTDELSPEVQSELAATAKSFTGSFDPVDYHKVSSFKYNLSGKLVSDTGVLNGYDLTSAKDTYTLGDLTITTAPKAGVVVYYTDGYETAASTDITEDSFDQKNYSRKQLRTTEKIMAGEEVCKIISDESWSMIIPLSAAQLVKLSDLEKVKVKFCEDGFTETAAFSIYTAQDGSYCGKLDFENGMVRYVDDRFIVIELVTNTQTGLKIPISSIVSKAFYTIPEEYATTQSEDDSTIGFLVEDKDENGNAVRNFVAATLYEHKDGKYYVDTEAFEEGDEIVLKNSDSERYFIKNTESIEGVYCTNKGYAVFRKIAILDKNEEYCIVEEGTKYGISQYDYIVLNGSDVKENQIMVK